MKDQLALESPPARRHGTDQPRHHTKPTTQQHNSTSNRAHTNYHEKSGLDDVTLTRCLTLTENATQPPDEWLFIRDARSLVNAKQYRRAVIDSGTAAELAFTAMIDRQFTSNGTSQQVRDQKFNNHKGLYRLSQLLVNENAGTAPARLNEELGRPRNQAAHRGYMPSLAETEDAIAKATEIVEQAYPLASL